MTWSDTQTTWGGCSLTWGQDNNMTNFTFILGDNTPITKSFSIKPLNNPNIYDSYVNSGDLITSSYAPYSMSLVPNNYKIQCNNYATNDWYIAVDNSGSFNVISGSNITGSISNVLFSIADATNTPLANISMSIAPVNTNNIFNGSFVLNDALNYVTDISGNCSINLFPIPYSVTVNGIYKNTCFQIIPSGSSCNLEDIIVQSSFVSQIITPKNQAQYGYTAAVSDLRYVQINGAIASASFASTASIAVSASYAPFSQSYQASSSYALSASYAPFSQSYQASSSYALSASYAPFSQSYQISSSYSNTSSFSNKIVGLNGTQNGNVVFSNGDGTVFTNNNFYLNPTSSNITSVGQTIWSIGTFTDPINGTQAVMKLSDTVTTSSTIQQAGIGIILTGNNGANLTTYGTYISNNIIPSGSGVSYGLFVSAPTNHFNGNITASNISANLIGTASYAISSSYSLNSTHALSASYAPFTQSVQISSSYSSASLSSSYAGYAPVSRPDLNNGLILFFPLNEGTGSIVHDYSSTQAIGIYTASVVGTASLANNWNTQSVAGGSSIQFNGTTSYSCISVNNSNGLASGLNKMTMAGWFNIGTGSIASSTIFFAKFNGSGDGAMFLGVYAAFLSAGIVSSIGTRYNLTPSYPYPVNDNNWHLMSVTHNGNTGVQSMYLDGKLLTAQSLFTGSLYPTTAPIVIGNYVNNNTGFPFSGSVQNCKIWNRDLSPFENALLYQEFSNNFTSSFAVSASYAPSSPSISSSYASTASISPNYALLSGSSGLAIGSASFNGNVNVTGSLKTTYTILDDGTGMMTVNSSLVNGNLTVGTNHFKVSGNQVTTISNSLDDGSGNAIFNGNATSNGFIFTGSYTSSRTGSYTLQNSDNGKLVQINSGSFAKVTVPAGLNQGFACSLLQYGAGQIIVSGSGVTVNNRGGHSASNAQWSMVSLLQLNTGSYLFQGDTA